MEVINKRKVDIQWHYKTKICFFLIATLVPLVPSWKSYSVEYDELKQDILGKIIVDKVGWVDDEANTDATAFLFWCSGVGNT